MEYAIEAPEAGSTYGYGLEYHFDVPDNFIDIPDAPKERVADFDIHGGYGDDHLDHHGGYDDHGLDDHSHG